MSRRALSLLFLLVAGLAGGARAAGVGTTGGEFLKIGVGAQGLGMAGAMAAVADDVSAVYWNPAGLAYAKGRQLAASYNLLFKDETQGFLAYSAPVDGNLGVWAASIDYLWISNIEKRTSDTDNPDSTFTNQNMALAVTYAREAGTNKTIGVTIKHIRETLDTFKANSVAADLGFRAGAPGDRISVGLTVQNLGLTLGGDPLPVLIKGGVGYRPRKDLVLAADVDDWVSDARAYLDLGADYRIAEQLSLRAGYQFGRAQDNLGGGVGISGGAGLHLGRLSVDYAFLPFGDLGSTHRISLGWKF